MEEGTGGITGGGGMELTEAIAVDRTNELEMEASVFKTLGTIEAEGINEAFG